MSSKQDGSLDALDAVLGVRKEAEVVEEAAPTKPPSPLSVAAAAARAGEAEEVADGGPWGVAWGGAELVVALLGVEAAFVAASVFGPVTAFVGGGFGDGLAGDDPEATLAALNAFVEGDEYWRIVLSTELWQVSLGVAVLAAVLRPYRPLRPPLFRYLPDDAPPAPPTAAGSRVASALRERSPAPAPASGSTPTDPDWLGTALRGAAGSWLLIGFVTAALYALDLRQDGATSNSLIAHAAQGGAPGVATLALCTCVLAPAFEETVFRGFLLPTLNKWVPAWAAVVGSAAVFALVHEHNGGDTAQLFTLGLVNGYVYDRTKVLAAPILVHAIFNGGVLLLFLAWVS